MHRPLKAYAAMTLYRDRETQHALIRPTRRMADSWPFGPPTAGNRPIAWRRFYKILLSVS